MAAALAAGAISIANNPRSSEGIHMEETKEWYWDDGEQQGPVDTGALASLHRAGHIRDDTLVWCEGMDDWAPYRDVQVESNAATPPALPTLPPSHALDNPYAAPASSYHSTGTATSPSLNSMYGPFVDPAGRARALKILLWIQAGIIAVSGIFSFMQARLLSAFDSGTMPVWEFQAKAGPNDLRVIAAAILLLLSYIACVVMWCVWTNRIQKNAWTLNARYMSTTPGWAVGWYFIPIAHLWKPYQAIREAWDVSASPASPTPSLRAPILGWWWAIWIISNIVSNITMRVSLHAGDDAAQLAISSYIECVDSAVNLVSIFVAVHFVSRLTGMQSALVAEAEEASAPDAI